MSFPGSLAEAILDVLAGVGPAARLARGRTAKRRALDHCTGMAPTVIEALEAVGLVPADGWTVRESRLSGTGIGIVPIGPPKEPARLILKFAMPGAGPDALGAQRDRLVRLHADPRLADWAGIAPRILHDGTIAGHLYTVEAALPGTPAIAVARDARRRARFLPVAAEVIAGLHRRSAGSSRVDEKAVFDWIDAPMLAVAAGLSGGVGARYREDAALERLRLELRAAVGDLDTSIGMIHGDYWPGNILVTDDGSRVSGIVDWDVAADVQPALLDPVYLVLLSRRLASGRELGDIVCGLIAGDRLDAAEQSALAAAGVGPSTWEREAREALLLTWLRHVGHVAPVRGHYSRPTWVRRNVLSVLRTLPRRRPGRAE